MKAVKSISSWKVAVNLVREYNEISERFAEPMSDDEMNQLMERQGELQEKIDHIDTWDIDSRLEMAMDALRCSPGDTPIMDISSRQIGHPVPFPEELPDRLINLYTFKGDVVLDPFKEVMLVMILILSHYFLSDLPSKSSCPKQKLTQITARFENNLIPPCKSGRASRFFKFSRQYCLTFTSLLI
jgi:hypothetical protein